jgi:hypothetical protein
MRAGADRSPRYHAGGLEPRQIVVRQPFEPQFDAATAALPKRGPERPVEDSYRRRIPIVQQVAGRPSGEPFEPTAADGAQRSMLIHQHAGARLARPRAPHHEHRDAYQGGVQR